MSWPEAFGILFGLIGTSLVFHGFPDIKIGGRHEYHYHSTEEDDD